MRAQERITFCIESSLKICKDASCKIAAITVRKRHSAGSGDGFLRAPVPRRILRLRNARGRMTTNAQAEHSGVTPWYCERCREET